MFGNYYYLLSGAQAFLLGDVSAYVCKMQE